MQILLGFIRTKMTTEIELFPMSMKNKSAKKLWLIFLISKFYIYSFRQIFQALRLLFLSNFPGVHAYALFPKIILTFIESKTPLWLCKIGCISIKWSIENDICPKGERIYFLDPYIRDGERSENLEGAINRRSFEEYCFA